MENKFLEIKAELNKFLLEYPAKNNSLVSITLVGSHSEPKAMEQMNDLDVVFVFDELTKEKWDDLIFVLRNFAQSNETGDMGIVIETGFGPFKTPSGKPITVQIHSLLFDVASFTDYAKNSPLIMYDWQRSSPFYGRSLKEIAPVESITPGEVINARGGIKYFIEQIEEEVNITLTLGFDNEGKLTKTIDKVPQNNEQKAETCFKSIKNILTYLHKLRIKENRKPSDQEMDNLSEEILGDEGYKTMKLLEQVYKRARGNEEIEGAELASSQSGAKLLLGQLLEYTEKL